jgi:putative ABC transport system permease protein
MRVLDKARLRLRSLTRRGNLDRELDEEFRFHVWGYGLCSRATIERDRPANVVGATPGSILWFVLRQALVLTSLGLCFGLAVAMAGTRLLTSMLFRVKPSDPAVYLAVALLLGAVGLAASYFPARRASRIDPMTAIRQE